MLQREKIKIVLLEKSTLTRGDVALSPISDIAHTEFFEKLTSAEILEKCIDADIIICNKTPFESSLISSLPNLRLICVSATGYNNIDIESASNSGIAVCNVPGYSTESVVQSVFSLMLNLASNTYRYNESVQSGDWKRSEHFTYFPFRITELSQKTLGIVGYGNIGKRVASVACAFGMKVLITSKHKKDDCIFEQLPLEELLKRSDFLSLNCCLNDETRHIINKDSLKLMKNTAYIINTSRGPVVNEKDVAEAVKNRVIAGYGCDVIEKEPMTDDCALVGIPGIIITPHIAWASVDSRSRLVQMIANNIKGFIDGKPVNQVNL